MEMMKLFLLLLTAAAASGATFQLPRGTVAQEFGAATNLTAVGGLFTGATNVNPIISGSLVVPLGAVGSPSITFSNDLNTGIYSSAADTINFSTGGTERARIDSSGRLQLGSATGDQLIVANSYTGNAMFSFQIANSTKAFLGISANNDTPVVGMATGDFGIRVQAKNIFLSSDSGASGHLVVRTNGNVGVGTASPSEKLHVAGNLMVTASICVGLTTLSTNATLSTDAHGATLCATDGGSFTVTLPAAAAGKLLVFVNLGTNTISVSPGGGASFLENTVTNATTKGAVIRLMGISPSGWSNF